MIQIITTKEERNSLIPPKKFRLLQETFGTQNVGLSILNNIEEVECIDIHRDAVVLVETKNYDIVGYLRHNAILNTGEAIQTIKLDEDKVLLKMLLDANSIKTARSYKMNEVRKGKKYFVKPLILEDSIGIDSKSLCSSPEEVKSRVNYIWDNFHRESIIEDYIEGRDATVGIIQTRNGKLSCGIFIAPNSGDDFLTYEAKCADKETYEVCDKYIVKEAEKAFDAIQAKKYARIDLRVDNNNVPHVLEVNLYPGLGGSGYMYKCFEKNYGMGYKEMVELILNTSRI